MTLKTFSIDLSRNPTLADLLRQVRGRKVQVLAPNPTDGTVVGVERRRMPAGQNEVLDVDVLNLKTATGLRSIPLSTIQETRMLDEKLDKEFQEALDLLATAHSVDKKTVAIDFTGKGQRPVRVGYIQESPVWKTSYRLVLSEKEAPFLQGWAVVENTTEHDWRDVKLTLVSGRPISFITDLYEPLYVDRPVVVPDMFASLSPRTYDQDLTVRDAAGGGAGIGSINGKPVRIAGGGGMAMAGGGGMGGGFGGGVGGGVAPPQRPFVTSVIPVIDGEGKQKAPGDEPLDLKKGVASVAKADEVGELFRYSIDRPVTLPHQQSAMLPIVNDSVEGKKVSIYNPAVHPKFPLAGLKLVNTTKLHLMQGPITVFDGDEYAGDAQIEDIAPGAERLISYALDLNLEIAPSAQARPKELIGLKIAHGTLTTTHRLTRTKTYTLKNSGDHAKNVLIEQPIEAEWKLVSPRDPAQKTRDLYRFAVSAPAKKPTSFAVEEEHTVSEQFVLVHLSGEEYALFSNSKIASPAVKAALAEMRKLRAAVAEVAVRRHPFELQIGEISEEQARIRQNMGQLNRNTDLYNRYVKMFGDQEDSIAKARAQLKLLRAEEAEKNKALDEFIAHVEVE